MMRLFLGSMILALLMIAHGIGAERPVRIILSTDDDDGMVEPGQVVVVTANIDNRSDQKIRGTLCWRFHTVAFDPPDAVTSQIGIDARQTRTFTHDVSLPVAGFVDVECELTIGSHRSITKRTRLGREPLQLTIPLTKQPDFDQFWESSLAELNSIAPEFNVERKSERSDEEISVFEVTMKSFSDVRVRGWLEVPNSGNGPHPVVIRVPGYGANMKPVGKWKDMIVFSFNPRGHGNSQDDVPGKPVDYWIRGLDEKNTYFYRGAYLDCIRAVDYIGSRADVDQDRIAIWGGSQGGGFALATAGLDSRIDLCASDIPFLCDWVNYFKLTVWPEMNGWVDANEQRTWDKTLRTLSYFDTMNLADRIECPTFMGVGLQDQVCPPTTNFAAYNRIRASKSYRIYRDKGHGLGRDHASTVWQWIRQSFELADP